MQQCLNFVTECTITVAWQLALGFTELLLVIGVPVMYVLVPALSYVL
jgi:hypothetical protein